jgi:hypothetical protein
MTLSIQQKSNFITNNGFKKQNRGLVLSGGDRKA